MTLSPELEALVRERVASGAFATPVEVVQEALFLMNEHDRLQAAKRAALKAEIRKGLESGEAEPWDAETFKRKARARLNAEA